VHWSREGYWLHHRRQHRRRGRRKAVLCKVRK
jgi:hypothetical protein